MVYLGNRNTGNCKYKSSTDLLSAFYTFSRWLVYCSLNVTSCMDFFILTTSGNCRCRGENHIDAGPHTFRRDRTCQLIKCNPWSTRLCPHPTIIKKMKTYLELEGKLGSKPQSQTNQFRPPLANTNPQVRKESKMTEREKD